METIVWGFQVGIGLLMAFAVVFCIAGAVGLFWMVPGYLKEKKADRERKTEKERRAKELREEEYFRY